MKVPLNIDAPPPPPPTPPEAVSEENRAPAGDSPLPAGLSDDNLEGEGDAGFQPPGRQPSVPPSSKSDTATTPMDGFFDRPSSAPDGSGMLDYPELRKMTPRCFRRQSATRR